MGKKKYIFDIGSNLYDFNDKEHCVDNLIKYMIDRTRRMFKYDGLPDTIPERMVELYLQTNGNVCIGRANDGNIYAFVGGLGGEPDAYYQPTSYTVANSYLKFSKSFSIGSDCVVIKNDSLYMGMLPLYRRYATAIVENEISMRLVNINTRITSLLSAPDDRTMKSAIQYLTDIENGKIGVIGENAFLDGIKSQPYANNSSNSNMTNLIEYEQYLKGSWYNEIGLQSNFNMKRESINSSESGLNDDVLFPLIDDMFECRKDGIDELNKMFGLNVSINRDSSWEDNEKEIEIEISNLSNQSVDDIKTGENENESESSVSELDE